MFRDRDHPAAIGWGVWQPPTRFPLPGTSPAMLTCCRGLCPRSLPNGLLPGRARGGVGRRQPWGGQPCGHPCGARTHGAFLLAIARPTSSDTTPGLGCGRLGAVAVHWAASPWRLPNADGAAAGVWGVWLASCLCWSPASPGR